MLVVRDVAIFGALDLIADVVKSGATFCVMVGGDVSHSCASDIVVTIVRLAVLFV